MKDRKLPALQFYPGDWRKDLGVQSLSFHDRGVWFEMLMLMHDSERRGVLILNGASMKPEMIARAIGLDNQTFNQSLTTLLSSGVASAEDSTGAIYSRRMVRDENLRKIRAEAGSKGGNPILVKQKSTTGDKQKSTPSSSSSSSVLKPPPTPPYRGGAYSKPKPNDAWMKGEPSESSVTAEEMAAIRRREREDRAAFQVRAGRNQ